MKESYFYQSLKQIAGKEPPIFMIEVTTDEYLNNFNDDKNNELVDWVLSTSNIPWSTGQGLIDAAITLVRDAVSNGNIKENIFPEYELCLSGGRHTYHYFGNHKVRRCNNCHCLENEGLK